MLKRPGVVIDMMTVLVIVENLWRILDAFLLSLFLRRHDLLDCACVRTATDLSENLLALLNGLAVLVFDVVWHFWLQDVVDGTLT